MAHIQTGDYRKVFSQVAEQSTDLSGVGNALMGTFNAATAVAHKANESKLANYQIDLANKALKINNDINIKYQDDPTNPEREKEFNEQFELLASEYKVNPLVQGKWGQIKTHVMNNYKQYNARWEIQQQQTNASNDLRHGYEKLIDQVSMMGNSGASIDEVRLVYNNGISSLRNGANAVLGAVVTDNFLNDANHDYMASYIGALALNNPLQAQALMKDEGVLNDIGNAETIEKLNNYIATSFKAQSQKTAIAELGNSLRAMNSDDAQELLNGSANFNQVMRFVEKNKNIPEGSKEMLLGIYGIGSRTKYYYDKDKKTIEKVSEKGQGDSLGNLQLTTEQKAELSDTLQTDLHNMLTMFGENAVDLKSLKTSEDRENAQKTTKGYMDTIAYMQGRIDTALATGAIGKDERKRLIDSFIIPASDYVEQNLEQLDQGQLLKGKLGYDRIKKFFNTDDLTKEADILNVQQQKLFAQNYYLDELHQVVQKTPNLKSIYDIERLSPKAQKEIYEKASENAIKRAQRWTNRPEIFFAKEFPQYYSIPFKMYGQEKSLQINRNVAEAVYKARYEGINDIDLKDFAKSTMFDEIDKEARKLREKAGEILLKEVGLTLHNPLPKNYIELKNELDNLGYTMEQFKDFAYEAGYVNNSNSLMRGYMSKGYMDALKDIRKSKALRK